MSNDDTSRSLYGGRSLIGGPPAKSDGFSSHVTAEEQAALDLLYDGKDADTPAPAEPGQLHGLAMLDSAIKQRSNELRTETGATESGVKALHTQFRDLHRRTGLPEEFVVTLMNGYVDQHLLDHKPVADPAKEEFDRTERRQAWEAQTRDALEAIYGPDRVDGLLARARRFVKAHPALGDVLAANDLGSQPEIVKAIVAHVHSNALGLR